MSSARVIVERCVVFVLSCVFGAMVGGSMLWKIVKTGGGALTNKKNRSQPPKCLEDPSLGTHGYAHLEDIRMHYVSNGAEDKPLMLLVHGFPEFWYSWRYQLKEFKDAYRVVAVDLRGYGDSDKPSGVENYAVPVLIKDLKQLVTALGYEKCVLVGHDWGGALCWAFADKYPETVSRLVILNCPNIYAFQKTIQSSFKQFKMSWYMIFFQLPYLPELALRFNDFAQLEEGFLGKNFGVQSNYTTAEDIEAYKYNYTRNSFTGPLNFYRASFGRGAHAEAKLKMTASNWKIDMPTLVIWGHPDAALLTSMAQLSAEVCKGRKEVVVVEGASHWVQMDRPDLVNQHMRRFLDQE